MMMMIHLTNYIFDRISCVVSFFVCASAHMHQNENGWILSRSIKILTHSSSTTTTTISINLDYFALIHIIQI